jgi:hypothetical protein
MEIASKKRFKDANSGLIGRFVVMVLIAFGSAACSSSESKTELSISCVNERGSTQWSDGSVQQLTNNLGTEVFTWKKDKNVVETSVLQAGVQNKVEVSASLSGDNLVFSADSISYVVNTSTGKINITSTGDSPDGSFVMKMEGSCVGFK